MGSLYSLKELSTANIAIQSREEALLESFVEYPPASSVAERTPSVMHAEFVSEFPK